MRKQFAKTVSEIFKKDKKVVALLGDIGVFSFRDLFKFYPKRIYNIGILEQSMISMAAGLSNEGFKPIVHTIAPFMVSRALEQLKIDFGYNKLGGNFVSIGASYDYAALGCTHHCPEDINLMHNIPNMEIVVPGNSKEFNQLFNQSYKNNKPTYFRLSDYENEHGFDVKFGKSNFINNNSKITKKSKSLIIVEPFYSGAVISEVLKTISNRNISIESLSVPFKFLTNYGTKKEHDKNLGFSIKKMESIIKKVKS